MSTHTTGHPSRLHGLALLIVVFLLALTPFLVRSQTGSTPDPTATPDTAFVEECRRKLGEVLYFQGEVDAGREHPTDRLDDAINNYENFGCTWDMFVSTPTPALSVTQGSTPTPVATAIDQAFIAECQRKTQEIAYFKGEVDAGNESPEARLDDAINNFLNFGCTWDMFDDPVTATAVPVSAVEVNATPQPPVATATAIDQAFIAECQRKTQEIAYFKGEVDAGRERPDARLDDAINNFLNFGCTWDMFG